MNFNSIPSNRYADFRSELLHAYCSVRQLTADIAAPYPPEQQQLQSMPDASPVKWHQAHTTWFFETFILVPHLAGYKVFDPQFRYFFNSYYHAVGKQYPRPRRGLMVDPDLARVLEYRGQVDSAMESLLSECADETLQSLGDALLLGLNHEQQHQELIHTDVNHALNGRAFISELAKVEQETCHSQSRWFELQRETVDIGYDGEGFCFDNELGRHQWLLHPCYLSRQCVTHSDWLEFMEDGGYDRPLLWLSDGWAWKESNNIRAPAYWRQEGQRWLLPNGNSKTEPPPEMAVRHISYYEADAYASWRGCRLPREQEWEHARKLYGEHFPGAAWEWTQSAYSAYPGFKPLKGMAAEYNGKFMVNQWVLRGSSVATSPGHSRPSYRNFFHPGARWQFSGVRLAKDA